MVQTGGVQLSTLLNLELEARDWLHPANGRQFFLSSFPFQSS